MQHIAAAVLLAIGVIILAARAGKRQKNLAIAAVISVAAMVGIAVGLEFALDRTDVNTILLYTAYVLVVAVPVVLGLMLRKNEKKPV